MKDQTMSIPPGPLDPKADMCASAATKAAASTPPVDLPVEVAAWAATPIVEHTLRWKREVAEGLRNPEGCWVAGSARRRRYSMQPKPDNNHE